MPGWIQETFVLLFSLGTMCWRQWRSLPSAVHTGAEKLPLTDTIWTFTTVVHCLEAQMHPKKKKKEKEKTTTSKQELLQNSSNMKRENVLRHSLWWLRCVSRQVLCIGIYFLCCFNHIMTNEKEMLTQSKDSITKQIAGGGSPELYAQQIVLHT